MHFHTSIIFFTEYLCTMRYYLANIEIIHKQNADGRKRPSKIFKKNNNNNALLHTLCGVLIIDLSRLFTNLPFFGEFHFRSKITA